MRVTSRTWLPAARPAWPRGADIAALHTPLSGPCRQALIRHRRPHRDWAEPLNPLNFSGPDLDLESPESASCGLAWIIQGMDKGHKILLDALGFDPMDLRSDRDGSRKPCPR